MDEGKWTEFVKKTELYMKNGNSQNKNGTAERKNTKKSDTTEKLNVQFPIIRKNSTGSAVSMLQAMLQVKVDGIFGTQTETSLKAFQKNVKLTADGICGTETWKKVVEHMNADR